MLWYWFGCFKIISNKKRADPCALHLLLLYFLYSNLSFMYKLGNTQWLFIEWQERKREEKEQRQSERDKDRDHDRANDRSRDRERDRERSRDHRDRSDRRDKSERRSRRSETPEDDYGGPDSKVCICACGLKWVEWNRQVTNEVSVRYRSRLRSREWSLERSRTRPRSITRSSWPERSPRQKRATEPTLRNTGRWLRRWRLGWKIKRSAMIKTKLSAWLKDRQWKFQFVFESFLTW